MIRKYVDVCCGGKGNTVTVIFVEPAYGKKRHSCYYFAKVYVLVSVRPDFPSHYSYIYGWISNLFDTVVIEEKCHLKHFLGRLKVKVTLEGHIN